MPFIRPGRGTIAAPPGDYYSGDDFPYIDSIEGTYTAGVTLRVILGNVSVQTWTYQWYSSDGATDPAAISGATSSTYLTSSPGDANKIFTCIPNGSIDGNLYPTGVTLI